MSDISSRPSASAGSDAVAGGGSRPVGTDGGGGVSAAGAPGGTSSAGSPATGGIAGALSGQNGRSDSGGAAGAAAGGASGGRGGAPAGTGGATGGYAGAPASGISIDDPVPGFASVAGGTTGGGKNLDAAVTVSTMSALQDAAKGTSPAIILLEPGNYNGTLTLGSNKQHEHEQRQRLELTLWLHGTAGVSGRQSRNFNELWCRQYLHSRKLTIVNWSELFLSSSWHIERTKAPVGSAATRKPTSRESHART